MKKAAINNIYSMLIYGCSNDEIRGFLVPTFGIRESTCDKYIRQVLNEIAAEITLPKNLIGE